MAELFLRQEMKLQQKLVMTQQLQLAIKLLQMSRMDLDQEIQEIAPICAERALIQCHSCVWQVR